MAIHIHRLIVLPGLLAVLAAPSLGAQTRTPGLYDKLELNFSITTLFINSDIRVDGNGGRGTDLDAEDDLGLSPTKVQPRAALRWRPGRRHELEVGYQFARRSADKVLQREIQVGDSTFEAGAEVKSTYNTDQAFLIYRFAFLAKDRTQVGVGVGLGALFVDFGLDARVSGVQDSTSTSANAPVASLGLYSRFLSGDRWYFEADARYIQGTIDRFEPEVAEWNGGTRYTVSHGLALEAGYGGSWIDVKVGPRISRRGNQLTNGGRIKYTVQHVRLGLVWVP